MLTESEGIFAFEEEVFIFKFNFLQQRKFEALVFNVSCTLSLKKLFICDPDLYLLYKFYLNVVDSRNIGKISVSVLLQKQSKRGIDSSSQFFLKLLVSKDIDSIK